MTHDPYSMPADAGRGTSAGGDPAADPATASGDADDDLVGDLSIGDLAERTGLAPATLRAWESRHDFPRPTRLVSGHRRYDAHDVELVRQVLRRRDAGARLEVAIAGVVLGDSVVGRRPGVPSVFASLRHLHPGLTSHRLRKSTLLALTHAIEDECCARSEQPIVFGAFQHETYYRGAQERWAELSRTSRSSMVFAGFDDPPRPGGRPVLVALPEHAPMRREWVVVCDSPDYPALVVAWQLPDQGRKPDGDRLFEALWTVDPLVVRDAARACAQIAQLLGYDEGAPLLRELAEDPAPSPVELARATSLLNRVVAYVDAQQN